MDFQNTLIDSLGIKIKTYEKNIVEMTMPVDKRTKQRFGFLHGGASVALAESAASIGSLLHCNTEEMSVFGTEINANHIKSKKEGIVTAKATPFHIGKATMVWGIEIVDENEELICISRCTVSVVTKRK